MLSDNDKEILQEIVVAEGDCMLSTRCKTCPFRSMCLPEFVNPVPPTPNRRMQMAMDVLFHNEVLDNTFSIESLKDTYREKIRQ